MQQTLLDVRQLKAGYGDRVVLHDVSMTVAAGEVRIILGGSGCGKSTLLTHILGLKRAWAGSQTLLGHECHFPQDRVPPELLAQTGMLFQNGALLSSLTVAQNVALPLTLHTPELSRALVEERVCEVLEQVRMLHAWHRLPGELSGGMRKRAALARALVSGPRIVFCDEPSAGLDPVTARELDDLLLELRSSQHLALVVVTHELESIKLIADTVLYLSAGRVLFDGPLAQALEYEHPEMRAFFAREASTLGRAPRWNVQENGLCMN